MKWASLAVWAAVSSVMAAEEQVPRWTADATEAVAAFAREADHANPRADANGKGTWAFYVEQADGTQRMMEYGEKAGVSAALVGSWMDEYYYLLAYTGTDSLVNVPLQGKTVYPGELFFHPGDTQPHVLAFTPNETGFYTVAANVRHIFPHNDGNEKWCNGIRATLAHAMSHRSVTFTNAVVCFSTTQAVDRAVTHLAASNVFCVAGETFQLRLDAYGTISGDASAVTFSVAQARASRTADWKRYELDANAALVAVKRSETPDAATFTDAQGATWELGTSSGPLDTLTPFAYGYDERTDWRGWVVSADWNTSKKTYPYLFANMDAKAKGFFTDGTGLSVGVDEFVFHPGERKATHVCFDWTAPADGVYRVSGLLRHIGFSNDDWADGVDGVVTVSSNRYAVSAVAAEKGAVASLDAGDVWLRAGERLGVALGPGGKGHSCDLSSCRFALERVDYDPLDVVSVDFDADGTVYAGDGRVGWLTNTFWNGWTLRAGAAEMRALGLRRSDGTTRTAVCLTLARAEGLAVSTAGEPSHALFADGVASSGAADAVSFTLTGLVPGGTYGLTLYGRSADGTAPGVFTVGDETKAATGTWFFRTGGEYAQFAVTADATGTMTGSFAGAAEGEAALWCGLQVTGTDFPVYVPNGTMLFIR